MSSKRRLDVSTGAGGDVTVARTRFDKHLDECDDCRHALCHVAQVMWRKVCVLAMQRRARGEG